MFGSVNLYIKVIVENQRLRKKVASQKRLIRVLRNKVYVNKR